MFLKKLKSDEYLRLSSEIEGLRLAVKSLELELQLYVRKLKASKGVKSLQETDEKSANEKYISDVLLKSK